MSLHLASLLLSLLSPSSARPGGRRSVLATIQDSPTADEPTNGSIPGIDPDPGSRLESLFPWVDAISPELAWLVVPVVLVGSYLLARFVHWWSRRRLERSGDLAETSFRWAVFEEVHTTIAVSIALFGVYGCLLLLDLVDSRLATLVARGTVTALVVLWARIAVRLGNRWIEFVHESDVDYEFAPIFKNVWTIAVVVGTALLLLSIWEITVTPFLASAGIAGIVVGFAAQDAISNLLGGVALYFDNTYNLGDVIQVQDGMRGTVTDIGIRSTSVITVDNVLVTVPNAVLNSTQVVTETAPQRRIRIRIPISVAYGTDYREVERLAVEVCEDVPLVLESPRPRVLFKGFGDSALEFELQAYIGHPLNEPRAVDRLNRGIYDAFEEAGITVPYPQRDVHVREVGGDAAGEAAAAVHEFDERHLEEGPVENPPGRDGGTGEDAE